jgi:hypothetical protein
VELFKDIVADIKKKRFEWIRKGQLRKYLRVKWREAEEGEDLD